MSIEILLQGELPCAVEIAVKSDGGAGSVDVGGGADDAWKDPQARDRLEQIVCVASSLHAVFQGDVLSTPSPRVRPRSLTWSSLTL